MTNVRRLLIANRGEIAVRIARTAREMGIATVAVFSAPDRDALHVNACDEAVALGGTSAAESYLDVGKLLDAAALAGADAVHPGYGFLSERADFARAVVDAGLAWVGPPPEAIAAMGDKLRAKALMADAGVPVLASTTDPAAAEAVGYPLMVKAAAGGGGKGMRVVARPADLEEAVAAARREAAAAFGDGTVFLERYVARPRHLEVQVLADAHGTVVHLGERECSVQRRHQKVIEESPSPLLDAERRQRLCAAAVAAATAIGYVSAGTVEFVADQAGVFAFLEVNTRLQVEHPVTEEAWRLRDGTGLDLVRLQLLIADGAALPFTQSDVVPAGHAIEARLYAEDPARGFLPQAGRVAVFAVPDWPGVRVDAGVRGGSEVTPHYDPMIAKVIASAPTRPEATRLLARALESTRLHGLPTNRDALVTLLRTPAFAAGELSTDFIAEHLPPGPPPRDAFADTVHATAAALAGLRAARAASPLLPAIPTSWRNNPAQPVEAAFTAVDGTAVTVHLVPGPGRRSATDDTSWSVDAQIGVEVVGWDGDVQDGSVDLVVGGRRLSVAFVGEEAAGGTTWYLDSALGHAALRRRPRFPDAEVASVPGSLVAPMPGTVLSVAVKEGAAVAQGDLLLVLEAMKMEHRVTAPHDGTVSALPVTPGARVDAGATLVVVDPGSRD